MMPGKRSHASASLTTMALLACTAAACGGGSDTPDAGGDAARNDVFRTDVVPADTAPADDPFEIDTPLVDTSVEDTGVDVQQPDTSTPDAGDSGRPDASPGATLCAAAGSTRTPPATYQHVIVIFFENHTLAQISGSGQAPYMNSLIRECGSSDHFLDNVFSSTDLVSEPHYVAWAAGSNCNSGVTPGGSGCLTTDAAPGAGNMLSTRSIFEQVPSWKSYQEDMSGTCSGSIAGTYAPKHNPPVFFSRLASTCHANDVGINALSCPTTVNTVCSTPHGALVDDITHDTLPALALVTPGLVNDMHDGTIAQGDNWLHTYLPLIVNSASYQRGEIAVYVLWDEGQPGQAQPGMFVSPYTPPTTVHTTINLYSTLRTIEEQLGVTTYLGCAGGTAPGGGSCPTGSTTDLRPIFHF